MNDTADVHARWLSAMRVGEFEEAWRQTDRIELPRRTAQRKSGFVRGPQHLVWDGSPLRDCRVLIRCEHGLGDTLQFARYVPLLRAHGCQVCVLAQPQLVELLSIGSEFGKVLDGWASEPPPAHDVEIECMELAYAFRNTAETLPREVPYLDTATLVHQMRRILPTPASGELRVGLVWASSDWDCSRSIPLADLAPLAAVNSVQFFSLQQGREGERLEEASVALGAVAPLTREVVAAARAMMELDLIISVDTMAAHLAGGLARPVWLLLQAEADWRWMTGRADSPWYPTMRIFRKSRGGGWRGLMEEVAGELCVWARERLNAWRGPSLRSR